MTKPMLLAPDTFESLQLEAEADRMLQELRGGTQDHAARTLVKDAFKLVLVVLRAGATLAEHAAPGAVMVWPVVGSLCLRHGETERALTAPATEVVLMGPGLRHSVVASTDCALLLVVG